MGKIVILPVFVFMTTLGCKSNPEGEGPKAGKDAPKVDSKDAPKVDEPAKVCAADPAWVKTPSPADSANFASTSNCAFHQWGYQSFLWLTSPAADGGLVFEGFANPKNLFVPEPGAYPGRPPGPEVLMLARVGKSQTTADIDSIFQAGPGNKILVDQNLEPIFYSNHLNQDFWDFIAAPDHQFNLLANLQKADPTLDFTVNSIELKASWRVAEKAGKVLIPDADERFFVVSTVIPTVSVDDEGMIVEQNDKPIEVKMALIGMHVAGVVKGHPEFIWATFEHVDNAPKCDAIPATEPAAAPTLGPSGQPWSLYDGKAPKSAANQFDTNNPLGPVNICLAHGQGGGSEDNTRAIVELNASVHALQGDSKWANYELGGAIWTNGDVPVNNGAFPPDAPTTATQLGSLQLANTTMESFTQNDNCFACHNAGAHEVAPGGLEPSEVNAKHINLSHFVVNFQAVAQGRSSAQAKPSK